MSDAPWRVETRLEPRRGVTPRIRLRPPARRGISLAFGQTVGPEAVFLIILAIACVVAVVATVTIAPWLRTALVSTGLLGAGFAVASATRLSREPRGGAFHLRDVAGALVFIAFALVILADGETLLPPA